MTRRATEALTPERYRAEAGPARSRIVVRVDGTHHFFTTAASARVILFPVRYALDERQFEALTSAAVSIDEGDGFYVHMTERATEPDPERVEDWWISFPDYETYFKDVPPLENLVHSPNGSV